MSSEKNRRHDVIHFFYENLTLGKTLAVFISDSVTNGLRFLLFLSARQPLVRSHTYATPYWIMLHTVMYTVRGILHKRKKIEGGQYESEGVRALPGKPLFVIF